ncbi:MAG: metallophosphoesterase family protein [bacterium]
MIYGVFSDIHSNYAALRAILDFFACKKVQGYIFCGDMVGYGPQPEECVKALASLPGLKAVSGNHDLGVTGALSLKWFNSYAEDAIEFTKAEISPVSLAFLRSLPEIRKEEDFTLVHGSPLKPAEEYLLTAEQYMSSVDLWTVSPCFIGHSHVPMYFTQKGKRFPAISFFEAGQKLVLMKDSRYMINPGSVGQSRDRDTSASCGIYDSNEKSFELFRLKYDVRHVQALMKEKGLPQILMERLTLGW